MPNPAAPSPGDQPLGLIKGRLLCRLKREDIPVSLRLTTRELLIGPWALDPFEILLLRDICDEALTELILDARIDRIEESIDVATTSDTCSKTTAGGTSEAA